MKESIIWIRGGHAMLVSPELWNLKGKTAKQIEKIIEKRKWTCLIYSREEVFDEFEEET